MKAWDTACATPEAVFFVPSDRHYLVNATRFKGPCEDRLVIQVTCYVASKGSVPNLYFVNCCHYFLGRRVLMLSNQFRGHLTFKQVFFIMILQIDGTIVAPDEPKNWDPDLDRQWLEFSKLNGVVFQGNGVIDGSGSKWWASSCKTNKTNVIIQKF